MGAQPLDEWATSPDSGPAPELARVIHRNIHTLLEVRREYERGRTREERVADRITRFAGSMPFVYAHALLFGGWILLNSGWLPGIRPFDPFPFVMLAMTASVEAIFLATFVLISQNRIMTLAEKRDDLELQISLLAEHEVTRLIHMVDAVSRHLGVPDAHSPEMEELKRDVPPDVVLEEIERAEDEWEDERVA